MTRFALRGLLGRKLRTALTALAIVLGVAMISGTYVLTDSIDQAFDKIFTDIRKGSNAVITGKSAFDLGEEGDLSEPTFDESLLAEVREAARRSPGRGERRQRRDAVHRRRRQSGRLRGSAEPRLLDRERRLRLQPAHARRGHLAGAERGRGRQGDRGQGGLRGRRDGGRSGRGPGAAAARLGDRPVQFGAHDRRGDARRLRPADRAAL